MTMLPLLIAAALQSAAVVPAAPAAVDCTDADHRALDFWIGDWDVSPTGATAVIARSRIEKIVGCAISETYDQTIGPGGRPMAYHGRSISSFVPALNGWRQFYVDSSGRAATLTGRAADGAILLEEQNGAATTRMTLKPNADGSVRQSGAVSRDGGKSWSPTFDFTYRPWVPKP